MRTHINRGTRKECSSCAGRASDGAVFERKRNGKPRLCTDCQTAEVRPLPPPRRTRRRQRIPGLVTREAYRHARALRDASPQMDWVDAAVPSP